MTTDYEIEVIVRNLGEVLADKNNDEIQEWLNLLADEIGRWSITGQWNREIKIAKKDDE